MNRFTDAYGFKALRVSDETLLLLANLGDKEAQQLRSNIARFVELYGVEFVALSTRGELFGVAL